MNQVSLEDNYVPLSGQEDAVVNSAHNLSEPHPALLPQGDKPSPVSIESDIVPLPEQMEAIAKHGHYLSERQPFLWQVKDKASKDIALAHRQRWPNRPISLASRLLLLAASPGLQVLLIHRIAHGLYCVRKQDKGRHKWFWRLMLIPIGLLNLTMIKIRTKSHVRNDCEIEGGVLFSDQGNTIFGAKKTGAGTVIGARVTVGMSHVDMGRPVIGRNVWIGSDCVLYGAINIGDGATLLPGTVLTKNIPAGAVMQGNPARLVVRDFDNSELRKLRNVDTLYYINAKQGES